MKRMKLTALIMSGTLLLAGATGCGGFRGDDDETLDPSKTYLFVGNYNGGLGYAWLEDVAEKYTALHPDVVIKIENDKDRYEDTTLETQIHTYGYDMYFVNGITYSNYVGKGLVADITDVVTEGGETSIESRMNPTLRDYYDYDKTEAGKKFYAVPFHDSLFGTVYDVDLFEGKDAEGNQTEDVLYFNTNGKLICDDPTNTTKSAGPNGETGDYDDGLPATFTEWKTLVDTMDDLSITPYTWTSEYWYYRYRWLTSVWADYEGKENFDLNMTFDGEYTFDGDTEPTEISVDNAYLLQGQLGKKYALEYAEYIMDNNYYTEDPFNTNNKHITAQKTYLRSVVDPNLNRIAMIMEGAWWENEIKDYFGTLADRYGDHLAYKTRKFGFMPTPKSDDGKSSDGTTLISSTANSAVFIYSGTQKMELAKDFFKFAHSEESMRTFTRVSGGIRPYDYTLQDTDKNEMTYFAKSMWDIYHDDGTDISYVTIYNHNCFTEKASYLGTNWWWKTTVGKNTYDDVFKELWQNTSLNAENWFEGLKKTYSESSWKSEMKDYLSK